MATATNTRASGDRADSAVEAGALDLVPAELERLWTALEGDWVAVLVSLWPSWGFCPRHAFGFAITEVELRRRSFTTGPFQTAILYEHFLEGAARIAGTRPRTWRGIRFFLTPRTNCFICERLASTDAPRQTRDWQALARQVNQRRRFHEQLEEARQKWIRRACPLCVPGGDGIVCRPHLLAGAKPRELGLNLTALSERLHRFVGSMTAAKTETTILDRFSLVETLGWFGGWEHARSLILEEGAGGER